MNAFAVAVTPAETLLPSWSNTTDSEEKKLKAALQADGKLTQQSFDILVLLPSHS